MKSFRAESKGGKKKKYFHFSYTNEKGKQDICRIWAGTLPEACFAVAELSEIINPSAIPPLKAERIEREIVFKHSAVYHGIERVIYNTYHDIPDRIERLKSQGFEIRTLYVVPSKIGQIRIMRSGEIRVIVASGPGYKCQVVIISPEQAQKI